MKHYKAMVEVLEMIEKWTEGEDNEFHSTAIDLLTKIRNEPKPSLRVVTSCTFSDFISEVEEKCGEECPDIESTLFDESLYPEGYSIYITKEKTKTEWLQKAFDEILDELKVETLKVIEEY